VTTTSELPPEVGAVGRPEASSMSVQTVRFDATRALIKVNGELDLSTAAPLWAVLDSHLGAGRRFLRLDLSGVTFLDTTALSGITRTHQELLARRGTLVMTGVRSLVGRVLRVTGLDEVLLVSGPRADDDSPYR
jgi:anti-sigma B factor antagonist